jgi:hypothetical protein
VVGYNYFDYVFLLSINMMIEGKPGSSNAEIHGLINYDEKNNS